MNRWLIVLLGVAPFAHADLNDSTDLIAGLSHFLDFLNGVAYLMDMSGIAFGGFLVLCGVGVILHHAYQSQQREQLKLGKVLVMFILGGFLLNGIANFAKDISYSIYGGERTETEFTQHLKSEKGLENLGSSENVVGCINGDKKNCALY